MRRVSFVLLCTMIFSLCRVTRSAATEFAPPAAYAVGANPQSVVVGDFNGDGKLDLAVLNTVSNNVSILLGNGNGSFQTAKNFDADSRPSKLLAGDFNGDGKLDLAVFMTGNTSSSVVGEIRILLGNGDGSFQAPLVTSLTNTAVTFAVGDFNGDKFTDVIVGNYNSQTKIADLRLFLGKGGGTFQAAMAIPVSTLMSAQLVVGDFNKDGKLDLAVNRSDGIAVLQGKGDGTFAAAAAATPLTDQTTANTIGVADFNNDGNPDLIVDSSKTSCGGGEFKICTTTQDVGVLLGDGKGSFSAEQLVTSNSHVGSFSLLSSLAAGDFNGDGNLDIVYGYLQPSIGPLTRTLQVKLGKGDGTFSPSIVFAQGTVAAAADLNGDKLADLVTLDSANGNVDVLLNDSQASGIDLGIILGSASPEPVGIGQNLTYTADVLNEGPQDATGVTLKDTLPASVSFVSATASQGTCLQSGQVVTCTIGTLADTRDAQITITVKPNTAATITNNMNATGDESDPVSGNNSASQVSTVIPVYTLTVTKSGNGSGTITSDAGLGGGISCGQACTNAYLAGATAILNQNLDPGSLLQSWGGACAGSANNGGCNVVMDSNKTVTANIVLGITLNVSITGGGTGSVTSTDGSISCSDTGGICSTLNLPGAQISLTAMPSSGSQFVSWSGGCTGTDPKTCNITLNSNQTVTANILPPPDFTVQPTATSLSLTRGSQVSEVLTFPAQGGFSGTIALTCTVTGPAPMPTCAIASASVKPGGTATLMIDASALSAGLTSQGGLGATGGLFATWLPLGLFGCVLTRGFAKKRRRQWALSFLAMVVTILPMACGGGNSVTPPPVARTYTVTVTATSGTIQHSTAISVTVQ
jgi:uncharacterized repeat protein (TIGR01451 family)